MHQLSTRIWIVCLCFRISPSFCFVARSTSENKLWPRCQYLEILHIARHAGGLPTLCCVQNMLICGCLKFHLSSNKIYFLIKAFYCRCMTRSIPLWFSNNVQNFISLKNVEAPALQVTYSSPGYRWSHFLTLVYEFANIWRFFNSKIRNTQRIS